MKDTYQVKSVVMDDVEIERSLTRIAHQILEATTTARRISRLWESSPEETCSPSDWSKKSSRSKEQRCPWAALTSASIAMTS